MTIEDQIKDEKLQYDINREAAKISALSSNKIDNYEYLTGENILPFGQQQIIEQAKFTYSPLGKAFNKQTYVINDLNDEEIIGTFYEKELQKTNQEEFRIEKVIKRKGDKIYVKWKGYDNSFNSWIDKASIVERT